MKTIRIAGARLTDTIFTLEAAGWPEITWNITQIQRDADLGVFGKHPTRIMMSSVPAMNDGNRANVDWQKVESMARQAPLPLQGQGTFVLDKSKVSVIDKPGLSVIMIRDGVRHRFPVDGNHRLAARMMLGLEYFETFVVPPQLERCYRVIIEETDV